MPATSGRNGVTMQSRTEKSDSLDDFPTPPWATRAFIDHALKHYADPSDSVLEPCCNRGFMSRPLMEYFRKVESSDIGFYDWPGQNRVANFLTDKFEEVDWVITNPPYRHALTFIERGLKLSRKGVAVIVRGAFPEGQLRYQKLFKDRMPTHIVYFVERVSMVKGCYDPSDSHAIQYMWMLWVHGQEPKAPIWIPPCRKSLMRATDTIINPAGAFA